VNVKAVRYGYGSSLDMRKTPATTVNPDNNNNTSDAHKTIPMISANHDDVIYANTQHSSDTFHGEMTLYTKRTS